MLLVSKHVWHMNSINNTSLIVKRKMEYQAVEVDLMQFYKMRIFKFIEMYFGKMPIYLTIYSSQLICNILISLVSQIMQKVSESREQKKESILERIKQNPDMKAQILLKSCLQKTLLSIVSQIFQEQSIKEMNDVIFQVPALLRQSEYRSLQRVLEGFKDLRDSTVRQRAIRATSTDQQQKKKDESESYTLILRNSEYILGKTKEINIQLDSYLALLGPKKIDLQPLEDEKKAKKQSICKETDAKPIKLIKLDDRIEEQHDGKEEEEIDRTRILIKKENAGGASIDSDQQSQEKKSLSETFLKTRRETKFNNAVMLFFTIFNLVIIFSKHVLKQQYQKIWILIITTVLIWSVCIYNGLHNFQATPRNNKKKSQWIFNKICQWRTFQIIMIHVVPLVLGIRLLIILI